MLVEYPGVGRPNDLVAVEGLVHDAESLVSVGIAEWVVDREVAPGRRSLSVEDTTRVPARERTVAVDRGSVGGEVTRRGPKRPAPPPPPPPTPSTASVVVETPIEKPAESA